MKLVLVGWVVLVWFFGKWKECKGTSEWNQLNHMRDLEFGEQNRKCTLSSTGPSSSQRNSSPKNTEGVKNGFRLN